MTFRSYDPPKIYQRPEGPWPKGMAWYPLIGRWGPVSEIDFICEDDFGSGFTEEAIFDSHVHWKTKDGRILLLTEMTDVHLYNSIRMVWRNAKRIHAGLQAEWVRRGHPPNGWKADPP